MKAKLLPLVATAFTLLHASAAIWQWDGQAGTGDWQTPLNWGGNVTASFNGTFADRLNVNGAQELIYSSAEGTTTYGSASVRGLVIGSGAAGSGTMTITGGTFSTLAATGASQDIIGNNDNNTGTLNISGGTFIGAAAGTAMGIGGGTNRVAIFNINSGNATVTSIVANTGTATINLSGGILTANSISRSFGTLNFNFSGGTLVAGQSNPAFMTGLSNVNVNSSGAVVDSNGFDITIGNALKAGTGSGGLTKQGAGTLTLTAAATYNGTTTISSGILQLGNGTTDGSIANSIGIVNNAALSYNLAGSHTYANVISGSGIVSKSGAGSITLSNSNTYLGATSITAGTLALTGAGAINSTTGITLNGATAKFNASGSTPVSPVVTLTQGTVSGSGTVNTVNVGAGTGGIITNNDGVAGDDLAIGTLTLAGGANINLFSGSTSAPLTITSFINNSALNEVTLTANNAGGWVNGSTYDIITYGGGSIGGTGGYNFNKAVNNLSARQAGMWADTGSSITLAITGESVTWTGAASGNWTTDAVGSPFNWKTSTGGVGTDFLTSDEVIFNDTASTFAIEISTANVSPYATTFSNSSANYTVSSAGGFGIASGPLTKSGTGTLTLTSNNTYTGTTAINGGTLRVSGGSAIANTGLVTLADAAGATFQVVGNETIGSLSGGGATGGAVTIDAGQMLTLASGTQTYNGTVSGSGTLANAGATQTLAGNLSHTGGVNANSGVLTLGSSSNTYAGNTTIASGAGIVVTANNALGATGAGNETVIIGTGSGAVGGALGLSGNVNYSAAEKITGSGVGNIAANGVFASVQRGFIQSVSGNNTFAGPVEINATGLSRIGTQTGARLTLSGSLTMAAGVSGVQPLFRSGDNDGDFVTLSNAGNNWDLETLVFSGGSTGNAGLRLGTNNALPTGISILGATSSLPATALDLAGYNQTLNGLAGSGGAGQGQLKIVNTVAATTSVLTLSNTLDRTNVNTAILDGVGQIAIVKQGAFSQSLGAGNTYTGTTTIQGGTLEFAKTASLYNGNNASWTAANISVDAGATLSLAVGGAGEFTGADAGTVIMNLTTGINNNGLKAGSAIGLRVTAPATVPTVIADSTGTGAGALALVKSGASTLTLDQANTYSGGTRLADGYLTISHSSALGTGNLTLGAGAERLNVASGVNVANAIIIDGANPAVGNGAIQNLNLAPDENATVSGNITINALPTTGGIFASQGTNSTLTIAGAVLSANTTVSVRTGTVVFSGSGSSYAALQVTGTVRLGAANALATNAVVDLGPAGAAGVIDLAGFDQSLAGVTKLTGSPGTIGNSSNATDSTLTLTGTSTYAGIIQDSLAGGTRKVNLAVNGPGQTATLTAANAFTGVTTVTAGTLVVSSTGSIASSASTVNGGTLTVNGLAGDVTVNSGGTLTGNGTAGALVVNAGGSLAPGSSPGVLSLSLASLAGTTTLELAGPGGVPGTDYDRLVVTGAITYGGALSIVSFGGYDITQTASYDLFNFGSQSGDFATVTVGATGLALNTGVWTGTDISGNSYSFSQIDGTLSVVAIPEPHTVALIAIALGLALIRLRPRRA